MSSRSRILGASVVATLAVTLTATLTVTTPAPAGAGVLPPPDRPGWGPTLRVAANPRGEALAIDDRGAITLVWATSTTPGSVVALRRQPGRGWGDPVVVGRGSHPQVAADGVGNVTVAWLTHRRGVTDGVAVARRPAGGHWSAPVRVSTDRAVPGYPHDGEEAFGAAEVSLAVSSAGDAVVAWAWGSDDRGRPWRVQAVRRPAGGRWSDPVGVTPADGSRRPQVGIDADGGALVLYGRQRFGHPQVLRTQTWPAGGTWTDPQVLAWEGYGPSLAVDRAGNAVVAFTPDFTSVRATARPAGGVWERPQRLSPAGADIEGLSLAMNEAGAAVLALGRPAGRVDVVRRPPGGPWSEAERVVRAGTAVLAVVVALDDAGDTFLAWGGYALLGTYRPSGGTWGEPVTISPDPGADVLEATYAQIAPEGDVAVLWKQESMPLKVRLRSAGPV